MNKCLYQGSAQTLKYQYEACPEPVHKPSCQTSPVHELKQFKNFGTCRELPATTLAAPKLHLQLAWLYLPTKIGHGEVQVIEPPQKMVSLGKVLFWEIRFRFRSVQNGPCTSNSQHPSPGCSPQALQVICRLDLGVRVTTHKITTHSQHPTPRCSLFVFPRLENRTTLTIVRHFHIRGSEWVLFSKLFRVTTKSFRCLLGKLLCDKALLVCLEPFKIWAQFWLISVNVWMYWERLYSFWLWIVCTVHI